MAHPLGSVPGHALSHQKQDGPLQLWAMNIHIQVGNKVLDAVAEAVAGPENIWQLAWPNVQDSGAEDTVSNFVSAYRYFLL